jgi:hypothetical protein
MPFVVVYDANALYGNAQRDLLIRIARSGLVQAKWTDEILDEMTRNLGAKRPDIPPGAARPAAGADEQRSCGLPGHQL